MNPDPVRVAIVDDHPMFRMGLAAAIEEMDGIVLVGLTIPLQITLSFGAPISPALS